MGGLADNGGRRDDTGDTDEGQSREEKTGRGGGEDAWATIVTALGEK